MDLAFAKEQTLRVYPHFMLGVVAAENLGGARLSHWAFIACVVGYAAFVYAASLLASVVWDWRDRRSERRSDREGR